MEYKNNKKKVQLFELQQFAEEKKSPCLSIGLFYKFLPTKQRFLFCFYILIGFLVFGKQQKNVQIKSEESETLFHRL